MVAFRPRYGEISDNFSMSWCFEWGGPAPPAEGRCVRSGGKAKSQSGPPAGLVAVAGAHATPAIDTNPSERGSCPPMCPESGEGKPFPMDAA